MIKTEIASCGVSFGTQLQKKDTELQITHMSLRIETLTSIYFPFFSNGKLMFLDVPIYKHIRVQYFMRIFLFILHRKICGDLFNTNASTTYSQISISQR